MSSHFAPTAILTVLDRHQVRYVLVGGYAAQLHGATRPTTDIDVTPQPTRENLTRLSAALRELSARVRVAGVEGGLPFSTDATALAGMNELNLTTRHGDLDLTFTPSGTGGYDDLSRHAEHRLIGTVTVQVATLADIIRSKQAAARLKDLQALPELRALAQGPPATPGPGRTTPAQVPDWTRDDDQDRGGQPADRGKEEATDPSLDWADDYEQQHEPDRDDIER